MTLFIDFNGCGGADVCFCLLGFNLYGVYSI